MTLHAFIRAALAVALPFAFAAAPAAAKGPKKSTVSAAKGPKTTATSKGPKTTGKPTTTTMARGGGKPTTTTGGGKAKTHGRPATTTTASSTTKPGKGHGRGTTGTTATGGDAGTPLTDPTLNRAQQRLASDPKFRERMEARLNGQLPAGMTIDQAAAGFRNLGQFIAAVNVSNNLGIPFTELRARMIGVDPLTGTDPTNTIAPMSLGQAIQAVKGLDEATATQTASTALAQANAELSGTTTTTTTRKGKKRS
ncbi:MAG TPA: hypothetical protein VFM29_05255 [Vicinamibacteria bacterium]|nr:hypothetical protein [Vicinamibacteria bacterium]